MRRRMISGAGLVLLGYLIAGPAISDNSIKVSADFRYRHETINIEDQDARNRHRVRARAAVQGSATDWASFTIRMVSGSANPTTLMQSLDGGFSDKPLTLDLAYLDVTIPRFERVQLLGGKIPNPFRTTPLVWDADVSPEGLAIRYSQPLGIVAPLLNAGFFWVEERASEDDSYLIGAQAGAELRPSESSYLMACGGLSQYTETKEREPFFDATNSKGNSVDSLGNYLYDYSQVEAYAELGTKAGAIPVSVCANYVTNTGADSLNKGFLVGIGLGKANKPNSWQIKYDYRRLERDAVIGAFADSDPWTGGTDGENHKLHAVYQLASNTQLGLVYFLGKDGLEDDAGDIAKLRIEANLKI